MMTKVHIAMSHWPSQNKQTTAGTFTLEQINAAYDKFVADKAPSSNLLHGFCYMMQYHNGRAVLDRAVQEGYATLEMTGNHEGFGVSTTSKKEAMQLATATQTAFATMEAQKQEKETREINEQRERLLNLSTEVLARTVYVYAKQDYPYRGLGDSFQGPIPLKLLRDYMVLKLTIDAEATALKADADKLEAEFDELMQHADAHYSLLDLDPCGVDELINKGSHGCSDEIGYIGLSMNSIVEAKDLVRTLYLEQAGL